MVGAVPKKKAGELTDRINDIGQALMRGEKLDDWNWRRLLKDLQSLEEEVPNDAGHALRGQAVMWSFKGDNVRIDDILNRYARTYGKDWDWYYVRAMIGPRICRLDMVTDMLSFGYPKDHIGIVANVADICFQAGLFISSYEAASCLLKLGIDDVQVYLRANVRQLVSAARYLDEHKVSELDIAHRVQAGSRVVASAADGLRSFSVIANEFGITFEYCVNFDIDALVEIDMQVSERLAEMFEDTFSQHISIGVSPMDGELRGVN